MKKLQQLEQYITNKLYSLERKVLFMTDSNHDLQYAKEAYLAPGMSQEQIQSLKDEIQKAKRENQAQRRIILFRRSMTAAAAFAAAFILLPNTNAGIANAMENIPLLGNLIRVVTFRDYHYEDERNTLNVTIPELVADTSFAELNGSLYKTTAEINAEIQSITESLVTEFEENLKQEQGYQNITVQSDVLSATQDYFTLKLTCFQAMGSGAEWNYYYTVDFTSGERLSLSDLFPAGYDYCAAISADIRQQMTEQMAADENLIYWLDDSEVPEWNFQSITEETSFYLNQDGRLVICFDEGDVAPMYMGCVEFVISEEIYDKYK